jgi:hypothetical protein
MALTLAKRNWAHPVRVWTSLLLAFLFFGILPAGCGNSCFVFISNPPTGTVIVKAGDSKSSCMLTTASGNVRVLMHTVSTCSSCPTSSQIAHIFVSLRGVEIHSVASADDASPDWQELMPKPPGQPLQFDLMSAATTRDVRLPLGEVIAIPADSYRQLRVRFVPNHPSPGDPVPEQNSCGGTGFNCVVLANGRTYRLFFDAVQPEVHIGSERMAGGSLLIFPDSDSNLVMEFKIDWFLGTIAGEGVHLLPVLISSASIERRPFKIPQQGAVITRNSGGSVPSQTIEPR